MNRLIRELDRYSTGITDLQKGLKFLEERRDILRQDIINKYAEKHPVLYCVCSTEPDEENDMYFENREDAEKYMETGDEIREMSPKDVKKIMTIIRQSNIIL